MRTLKPTGERINIFDNLETQTVATFNQTFPECPVDEPEYLPLSIGEYVGADRRVLTVGTETLIHKMFRDILYGIDRDSFYEPDKDEPLTDIMGHAI